MIVCKELNQSFETKEMLFKALKESKNDIISFKKAQVLKSCNKGQGINVKFLDNSKLSDVAKGFKVDENYYYIAVNSTRVLDSHKDLHLDGIWNKSVKEQQGRNYLVLDHELKVSQTVVKKEHIEMFTTVIPFSVLGKGYKGDTEVLIYKFSKDKVINSLAKEWLESGDDIEASVRMQYVKIELAMNSTLKEDVSEKKEYDTHIDSIANKADFESIDYFFTVKEAKNIAESSLVPFGSNGVTGVISEEKTEAVLDTSKTEAEKSLQNKQLIINHLNN